MLFFKKKEKNHLNLLVVEDDALLSKVLVDVFTVAGFDVKLADNGLKVMELALSSKPKMILLDLILPGIDGFEVLRQLKADDKTKDIPVVVLSNLGEESDVRSAKSMGAEDFFIKSNIGIDKLVDMIKRRLNK